MIDSVFTYIEEIKKISQKFDNKSILAFRGESKDNGDTKLVPSLFRKYDSSKISNAENIMLETVLDSKISNLHEDLHKAMDSQHYAAVSRLLDVSFNCLTALYFALDYATKENNPIVYIFEFPTFMSYSANSEYLTNYYKEIIKEQNNNAIPQSHKLILYSFTNDRIISQDGGFILFPGKAAAEIPDIYYEKLIIDKNSIENIKGELSKYFNITESKIFPEREKSKDMLKKQMETRNHYFWSEDNLQEFNLFSKKLLYELIKYKQLETIGKIKKTDYLRKFRKAKETLEYYRIYCDIDEKIVKIILKEMEMI